MKRTILTLFIASLFFIGVFSAQKVENIANVEFQPDERIFTVMCALHVAGYDLNTRDETADSIRKRILHDLDSQKVPTDLKIKLKDFYQRHNVELDTAKQQPKYVTFSLMLKTPPLFTYRLNYGHPAPSVSNLKGFEQLLYIFYKRANIHTLWLKWRSVIVKFLLQLRGAIKDSMLTVLHYSHMSAKLYLNRRIIVIPDFPDAQNIINAVKLGGNYFVIVSPSKTPSHYKKFFIHEYFHYLLDNIIDGKSAVLNKDKNLLKFMNDHAVYLKFAPKGEHIVRESLINALELAVLSERDSENISELKCNMMKKDSPFIPFFENKLHSYKKRSKSLPDFVKDLFDRLETKALCASYKECAPSATEKIAHEKVSTKANKRIKMLIKAQQLIATRNWDAAEEILVKLLAKDPGDPNTLFGMGQISYGKKAFEAAINYYKKAIHQRDVPLWIKGWAMVKIGYALYHEGNKKEALSYFEKASQLQGGTRGASQAALRALQKLKN